MKYTLDYFFMIKYNRKRFKDKFKEKVAMDQKLINRINELSKKSKDQGLTESEKQEQQILRKEYLQAFRNNFKKQLDNIDVTYVD